MISRAGRLSQLAKVAGHKDVRRAVVPPTVAVEGVKNRGVERAQEKKKSAAKPREAMGFRQPTVWIYALSS